MPTSAPIYRYDDTFFDTADQTAAVSAEGLIKRFVAELPVKSVLDVGCGRGVWLSRWLQHGASDVIGVDGPYVDTNRLHIPRPSFLARDVSEPFALDRQFELVQSLEVAEHLPEAKAETFVDNLVRHGHMILFSAAIPGQGGEHHVNEQPWEYWRAKFAARGYQPFDFLRPRMRDDSSIFFCYRFNSILYVHDRAVAQLPAAVRAGQVKPGEPLPSDLPLWLQLRLQIVQRIPPTAVDQVAKLRYRLMGWGGALRRRLPARH
jgi:SAM-dependent methyltransferase